ncbi:signal peptide peptidase SppA [Maribacter algarum]|uniref:Signal peptide peptidase SppA n=1 Tax=Maribacter algarum (ex Zhang et al. 2020) TaxID=2578118 RepID=A0A5S3PT65_9FLAO|nr:signal peptide peptidase SppA [Maribacter algarum]TMM58189.1 signal peptide peptidase SppA [Maribacter algarum]
MKFLRNFLAAILGCLVAFGIVFFMFFLFASLFGSAEDGVAVKKNSVLELQLQLPISDYVGSNADDPFGTLFQESQGLDEILNAIEVAKNDDDIKGISINNNFTMAGYAQTQEIRRALQDFKNKGKFIYTFSDFYMQKDYYLASVADSIFINPVGAIDFKGLASEVLFFKDLQEKTGVKMEVIRHGKYKSAVEPFLENEMSDANRTQIKELISSLWNSVVEEISDGRNILPQDLNRIADTLGGRTPELAKASGLIDGIVFHDQYEAKLKYAVDSVLDNDLNIIALEDYLKRSNPKMKKSGKDKIAVIYAQGEIIYGEGGPQQIGQGLMNEAIIKAKEDDKVKAIVLRVDSPGGSALTSDIIWREIELAKEKKPVVVSMGNVAASGGYYIAAGANKIFAEPTTITGSIGVFGTIPNMTELAEDIGINAEQVGTNENSVDYSLFEPMTDTFRNTVQEGIEDVYETFLDRVSQGRGITVAQADSLAQGRVWSGVDAKNNGLVDELGNLNDAIEEAAKMAEIEEYGIKKFPRYKTGLEQFMEDFGGAGAKAKKSIIEDEIGVEAYTILKQIKSVMEQKGPQARMPFVLDIK